MEVLIKAMAAGEPLAVIIAIVSGTTNTRRFANGISGTIINASDLRVNGILYWMGSNALHAACRLHVSAPGIRADPAYVATIVEGLLQLPGIDINAKTVQKTTALHIAAESGYAGAITALLQVKGVAKTQHQGDVRGQWPIHLAASMQHVDAMRALLRPLLVLQVDGDGGGGSSSSSSLARKQLDAAVNAKADLTGWTVLDYAADKNFVDVVDMLAEEVPLVCNPNMLTKVGDFPLNRAVMRGHAAIVTALARLPLFDVDCRHGASGGTALHTAAYYGRVDVVEALLAVGGIDLAAENKRGETALALAEAGAAREGVAETPVLKVLRAAAAEKAAQS